MNKANLDRANFLKADLSEACLSEAQLTQTDLIQTNLARANLTQANLTQANLTQANLVRAKAWTTNFDRSILTGACLENIQLNNRATFDDATCEYIYLKYYQKQRQPQDSQESLSKNQFHFIIQDLLGSVHLVLKSDTDWAMFLYKLHHLQSQYKDRTIEIRSIEVLPNCNYLVKIDPIPNLSISKIQKYFRSPKNIASQTKDRPVSSKLDNSREQFNLCDRN